MEKLNKTPTHQLLGWTEGDYEKMVFQLMLSWSLRYCKGGSKNHQKLLINKPINKWFLSEYSKLLKEFKNCLKPYLNCKNVTNADRQKLFIDTVTKIYDLYPSALLKQIEKC